jgi:hypothetical protein
MIIGFSAESPQMFDPITVVVFVASLLTCALIVWREGPRIGEIGPAILVVVGLGWKLWLDWLRYRSWVRHGYSGLVPPRTGHLVILGIFGCFVCILAAMVWTLVAEQ